MSRRPNSLQLNPEEARWLGVCAGVAAWLDIPAFIVRIVFIISAISWPPLILVYFAMYFFLDRQITSDKLKGYFDNATTGEHFKSLNYRKPIYKNESNKRIAGVCSGIADYLEVSPFVVRVVALLLLFTVAGPYAILAYIICIVAFDPDPYAKPNSGFRARRRQRQARREERKERKESRRAAMKERYREVRSDHRQHEGREDNSDIDYDDEFESDASSARAHREQARHESRHERTQQRFNREKHAEIYNTLEMRLREIEACMTSKKFRLHCEINRA